jgi:Protein of unknown function (DUF551)
MSDWINAKKKLPEPEKEVLFYFDNRCHVGHYIERVFGTNTFMWWSSEDNCVQNVDFWMPLPKRPEMKDDREIEPLERPEIPPSLRR